MRIRSRGSPRRCFSKSSRAANKTGQRKAPRLHLTFRITRKSNAPIRYRVVITNRTFWTIATAFLLIASDAAAQKAKKPAADYFPLRVEDSWTYRNTADDSRYTLKVLSEEKQEDGSTRYFV